MNKLFVFLIAIVAVGGCGSPSSESAAGATGGASSSQKPAKPEDLAGTWKVDTAKSVTSGMTDKEKEEIATVVVTIMADGTFTSNSGNSEGGKGT